MQKTIVQSTVAEILGCIALAWMQSGDIRPAETHRVLGKQIVGAIQLDQPGKVTDLKVRDTTTLSVSTVDSLGIKLRSPLSIEWSGLAVPLVCLLLSVSPS